MQQLNSAEDIERLIVSSLNLYTDGCEVHDEEAEDRCTSDGFDMSALAELDVKTYEDVCMLTTDRGLVIKSGSAKYQVTIVKV